MRTPFLIVASLCMLLFAGGSKAQGLTGIWKGTLTQGAGGCYPQYFLELQITAGGDRITGKAYDYYDTSRFVKMSFTGRYNSLTHRLVLNETAVLKAEVPVECAPCMKTYELHYAKNGTEESLTGDWKGILSGGHITCPPGKISLKKAAFTDFPADVEQSDSLAALQQALHLAPREKTVVKEITLHTSHWRLDFVDNGEIDGDTITVFVNNKIVLYKQMLTDKPLTLQLEALPNIPYEVVMYADNLGTIPPNTALMTVTAGAEKMEVFLSSSEEKSATVRFIYKPD